MRQRTLVLGVLGVGLLLISGARPVHADYTTAPQIVTIPLTQTDWGPSTASLGGSNPMSVLKFDAAAYSLPGQPAELTQVDLRLDYEFDNTISMRFDNVATITVNANGSMSLKMPDGTPLVPSPTFTNTGTQTSTPSDIFSKYVTLPTQVTTGAVTSSYTTPALLSQFLYNGAGDQYINLPASAVAFSNFGSSSGNGFGNSLTFASAQLTVVYHYLVPEPSSIVLAGLGFVGLLGYTSYRARIGLKKAIAD